MPYFITFEGPEGSGKTTVIEGIKEYLSKNYNVITTREPGGIRISEMIRDVLLTEGNVMDARTEALLFAASRRQHLVEKIIPALDAGSIVLCDRFIDSSLAYQGYAREIGVNEIWSINQFAIEDKLPDLTLYFKLDPEVGLARINNNGRNNNRLDKESVDFHERVVMGYNELSRNYPERIKVIHAHQSKVDVLHDAIDVIDKFINERG